ncbi:Fis family transcriptional regulator [Alteromonas sp. KUL42]|uniref:response regulator n=1 Tax=Alteromonas sp. KUL42 TaxID=2480797 RepID=UPI00103577D7|nr:response regulator [Alteromonas sp. KUL42]TAP38314.1 response regulator [Alteromonas sp. KUL42]GEA05554.1 Fis family transcriptional regulator [Alteromonas sp. KUL42]
MSKKILIVDDSPSIRQMVEVTLRSANYDITAAEDGKKALDICQDNTFDFVLTDVNMPNMDGITLVKSLRAMAAFSKTPIIVLTTEAGADIKGQGKAAGATGWMVKPFDPTRLLQLVAQVLG